MQPARSERSEFNNGLRFVPALTMAALIAMLGAVGCRSEGDTAEADPMSPPLAVISAASNGGAPLLASQLAPLRAFTAAFHNFQKSQDAGYTILATGCRENQPMGAMGYHYLNPAHLDGVANALDPEIVMYEPTKNGGLRFVGVEYIVPYAFVPETADPPTLFGQDFLKNAGDQLWMMHVWIGRHNPDGLLASWNPAVSCEYAN
jgi:hypothetical protein